jgi:hypothetical protein
MILQKRDNSKKKVKDLQKENISEDPMRKSQKCC